MKFACASTLGNSVIDYLLASPGARERVQAFELSQWLPESDHKFLAFTIGGVHRRHNERKVKRLVHPTREDRCQYEAEMENRLRTGQFTSEEVTAVILETARTVFNRPRGREKAWFDAQCVEARRVALLVPESERVAVHHDLYWSSVEKVEGVPLGTTTISMLLFADDVALVATSMEQLQAHITRLQAFCTETSIRRGIVSHIRHKLQLGTEVGMLTYAVGRALGGSLKHYGGT
ncbi:hypothetical protein R1sor_014111 [Riccia sorocarpa]|uniref:Reverse transcriptase domain-containing protein n=1 Tax=Riccia sorocarpa TaxID=122646 RepID=A0ABD3HB26_9MARC